jgi:hypothetical protein
MRPNDSVSGGKISEMTAANPTAPTPLAVPTAILFIKSLRFM